LKVSLIINFNKIYYISRKIYYLTYNFIYMKKEKMTFQEFGEKRSFDWYADRKIKKNFEAYKSLWSDWADYQYIIT